MSEIHPPQSPDIERALLGAIILHPETLAVIDLEDQHFSDLRNREVYAAMRRLESRRVGIEYLSLANDLQMAGRLDGIGGEAYLTRLVSDTPFPADVINYADIIRDKAQRRRIILAAGKLATAAYDPKANLDEAIATNASEIFSMAGVKEGTRPIADVLSTLLDDIESAAESPREIYGIPTGLAGFDRITAGLQRGEVLMLAGDPGVGKSFLAFQLAMGAAQGSNGVQGTPGAVFELEMTAAATLRRALSVRSRVKVRNLRSGNLAEDDWSLILSSVEGMSSLPVFISDRTDWTTASIRADCARLQAQGKNIGWILIDYFALLKDLPGAEEVERSAAVSDRLHDLAKDLDLAVIAVHDLTKSGITGHITGQAGLTGSRRVIYNADSIVLLKSTDNEQVFNLEWVKFREDNPNRVLPLRRIPGYPLFVEVSR